LSGVRRTADQGQRCERGDNVCLDWKSLDALRSSIDQGGKVSVAFVKIWINWSWHNESITVGSHLVYRFKLPLASLVVLLISVFSRWNPIILKGNFGGPVVWDTYVRGRSLVHYDQAGRLRNKEKWLEKVGKSVRRSTAPSLASKRDNWS